MMIYQAKFYTDVFGLKGAVAGSVLLIARIFKYFVILIVGVISDRTNTLCGKYISGEAVRNGGEGNFVCVELDFLNSHFFAGVTALYFYPITNSFNVKIQNELALRREKEKILKC